MLVALLAVAALIRGLDGFLLAFAYAVPVTVIVVAAASRAQPRWRVQLYLVMWTITRPIAFFAGLAAGGWLLAVLFVAIVFGLESIARRAHRRAMSD